MNDASYTSPDGQLRFLIMSPKGDVTMGFEGFAWHTHGDIAAGMYDEPIEQAVQHYIDDLLAGKLIIATEKKEDGSLADAWVTDNFELESRRSLETGNIEFRLWNGTVVPPKGQ